MVFGCVTLRASVGGQFVERGDRNGSDTMDHSNPTPSSDRARGRCLFPTILGTLDEPFMYFYRLRIFLLLVAGSPFGGTVSCAEIKNRGSGGNGCNSISAMITSASHL